MLLQLSFASHLHGIYFFHPITFSQYVSLGLKWASCRQHIYGYCFCIHSASLCLLVGAFNPFTFKVIIDIYVPIAIFLIVGVDFVDLFSSLVFLDYLSPFNTCMLNVCKSLYSIFCKAGLVVLNSLNFCLSEKIFISPSILNEIFAGYSNLGCKFSPFSTLNISCHSLWPAEFLLKDQLLGLWSFPCMLLVASPLLLLILFLCV